MTAIGLQNPARATSIEKLVMPGQVSAAHADFETECSECHAAFSKTLQRDLCLACHEHKSVLQDQVAGTGFHGRFEPARNVECSNCHMEHEGRDAHIVQLDMESFDHGFTDFALTGSHADLACEGCHLAGKLFRQAPSACFDCHREDDNHQGSLGENCASCHQDTTWQTTSFDHAAETDFKLTGAHRAVECSVCHTNQRYEGIPTDCYSCHQINDEHKGEFGKDCKQCHQTEQWKRVTFDHARASDFALQGRHADIVCRSCHQTGNFDTPMDHECSSCHLVDDIHQGSNGKKCESCHDVHKWSNSSFDHRTDTDFILEGAHEQLDCKACHTGNATEMSLDTACFSCHQLDDAHQSALGENCARCHQETTWTADVAFDHDLSAFPLIGLHATAPCEACHVSRQFTDTPGLCADCHGQTDAHKGSLGNDCASCHNPNDWLLWEFDHNSNTEFRLEGAHSELACQSCHEKDAQYLAKPGKTCNVCHRSDDIHAGQFGRQCARCHDTRSFGATGTLQ